MRIDGRQKLIAEDFDLAIDPLSGSSHPKGLKRIYEGVDIVSGLWTMFPVNTVVWWEMANKGFPCLRKFIMFDVEVGDYRVSVDVD